MCEAGVYVLQNAYKCVFEINMLTCDALTYAHKQSQLYIVVYGIHYILQAQRVLKLYAQVKATGMLC